MGIENSKLVKKFSTRVLNLVRPCTPWYGRVHLGTAVPGHHTKQLADTCTVPLGNKKSRMLKPLAFYLLK